MTQELIIDADAHFVEPPDIWTTWLPEKFRDQAPQLVKDADGGDAWLFAGATYPDPIGLVTTPGKPFDQFRWTGVTYEEARPGCYDGAERLKDMNIDGVHAELIFPPQRTAGHFLGHPDEETSRVGVEAINNFILEQFCAPDPTRLVPLAQVPATGIDDAIDTLRKAKARGFRGVILASWPSGGDAVSDADDAFWAAAVDEDMPIAIHIFMVSRPARMAQQDSANRAGGKHLYGAGQSRASAKAVGGLSGIFSSVPSTISQFIFTGVFERFPELRVALIETGVGWIPHALEQMDDRYWRNRSWGDLPIAQPPSHYWRQNMAASFVYDPVGVRLRYDVGIDNLMWSSDYPHHVNDWPHSRRVINQTLAGVSGDDRAKILSGNVARMFGLVP